MGPFNARLDRPERRIKHGVRMFRRILHIHGRRHPFLIFSQHSASSEQATHKKEHRKAYPLPPHRDSSIRILSGFPATIRAMLSADTSSFVGVKY